MSRFCLALVRAALCTALLAGSAIALPSAPTLKPAETRSSRLLPDADMRTLTSAMTAIDEGRWTDARALLGRLRDPVAKKLVQWRIAASSDSNASFRELDQALTDLKGWPDEDDILRLAESRIALSGLPAQARIDWLTARGPTTGDGRIALARAFRDAGRSQDAARTLRDTWRTFALSKDVARDVLDDFSGVLTADDHWARANSLMWRRQHSSAAELTGYLTADRRALANARLAVALHRRGVDALVEAVPPSLRDDPGLLFERSRYRRDADDDAGALELILQVKGEDVPPEGRVALWREKQVQLRGQLRERNYARAYQLAVGHGLVSGESFAEAEWTAGWIALRHLKNPAAAEAHFRTLIEGVSTAMSKARGQYWLAEALRAQSRTEEANATYRLAAAQNFTFYGQLAAERIGANEPGLKTLQFAAPPAPTEAERAAFEARPLVRAAMLAFEAGRPQSFERFSNFVDDQLDTAVEHQMLYDIAERYLATKVAVRGAKAGLGRSIVAPAAAYPVMELPRSPDSGSAEDAFVLALTRQESEFDQYAVSNANARGLMQMVPRYAQAEARRLGLPYKASWLTDDPGYNLRLGRGFLDGLIDEFGGSYILAAAAYNAGPSRARQWIADYGDPRGEVDPVDWIESIPFSETRNYVQRLMENLQVYRYRLANNPTQIQLSRDIRRGARR